MAFKAEYEQFEFEFDQEWADFIEGETNRFDSGKSPEEIEFFDVAVTDPYSGRTVVSLTIEQAREVRDIVDEQIIKYEQWLVKHNEQKEGQ